MSHPEAEYIGDSESGRHQAEFRFGTHCFPKPDIFHFRTRQ
jgi:hypothetical protein